MIRVTIYRDPDHVIRRCVLEGHAGYAQKGQDIICSAVSMLFINTANSIERFTGDAICMRRDADRNQYDLSFPKYPSAEAQLLMNALWLGLDTTRKEYGNEYLKITLKEVQ